MTKDEAPRFRQLLVGVASFYGKEASDFQLAVWWQALSRLEFEAVQDAFNRHLLNADNGQFMPKPADIVKLIGGGTSDRALVAWSKFELAVQFVGSWETVVFDDPIIHQVVEDMGGWVELCMRDDKAWPFVKNEFVQRYRGYATRPLKSYPAKLIGHTEAHNAGRFDAFVPEARYIGDREAARKVLEGGVDGARKKHAMIGTLLKDLRGKSDLLEDKSTS